MRCPSPLAMRLSEVITIYLAVGAPFGVQHFLSLSQERNRQHAAVWAAGAAILWPLVACVILLSRKYPTRRTAGIAQDAVDARAAEKIDQAKRKLLAALRQVQELARELLNCKNEKMEGAAYAIHESIERYVALTIAAAEVVLDAPPAEREMELCRIAGRTGDDLLLAGRCIHRRNARRIIAHQARARTELLHALAEIRELAFGARYASQTNARAMRHLSVALLKFYGHAINLLSLLEDESATRSAARLLDVECARLRRLEGFGVETAPERISGEEECLAHTPRPAFKGLRQSMTRMEG